MKKQLLFVATFFCALSLTAQEIDSFEFTHEYEEVMRLYTESKLDSAVSRLHHIEKILASPSRKFSSKEYILMTYTLSDIYAKQNKIRNSEQTIDKAEKLLVENGQQASPYRRLLLMQKGRIRLIIEDANGAKKLLQQAKDIFEAIGDISSIEYATCLSGLALSYQKTGDYIVSTYLLNYSIFIFKNVASTIGIDLNTDSRYMAIWLNLFNNFQYMGDIERVNNIREEILNKGENGGNYLALFDRAYKEIRKGNDETAIKMIDKAIESDYGYMFKDYIYQNLIISLYISDDKQVVDILKHYIDYSKDNLISVLVAYAESEREIFWYQKSLMYEALINAISWKYKTPELLKIAYNSTLFTKSLMTRFSKIVTDYAKENPSSAIRENYALLSNLKKKITTKGIPNDSTIILQERINTIEREILLSINSTTNIFDDSLITCDKVRQCLKAGEVAIEFVLLLEFLSNDEKVGYFGALIERPDFSFPIFVKLCKIDSYIDIMNNHEMTDKEFVNNLYSLQNEDLYNLIFQPIEKYLHDGETIYFSPVSNLHKINLQAIATKGKRLMDKYELIEVSSTAKIIEYAEKKQTNQISDAFLIGGVDYNMGIDNMVLESLNYSRLNPMSDLATRSNNRGSWDDIPGTLHEAQQIDSILNKYDIKTVFRCGGKANEESFKDLDGKSPGIVHIATHGFFYEDKDIINTHYFDNTNSYTKKRLPMQFSGLLFAGANNAWTGNKLPIGIEDGILTAEEISQMDLSGTDIAVLSACDTGLGEIDDVDGVYGLQRGFKMAGVETLVMSLWKIPDDATKILMVEFYKNLMSGKTKHQSLKDAQKYLRQVEKGKYDKPEYWASFIMLDGFN